MAAIRHPANLSPSLRALLLGAGAGLIVAGCQSAGGPPPLPPGLPALAPAVDYRELLAGTAAQHGGGDKPAPVENPTETAPGTSAGTSAETPAATPAGTPAEAPAGAPNQPSYAYRLRLYAVNEAPGGIGIATAAAAIVRDGGMPFRGKSQLPIGTRWLEHEEVQSWLEEHQAVARTTPFTSSIGFSHAPQETIENPAQLGRDPNPTHQLLGAGEALIAPTLETLVDVPQTALPRLVLQLCEDARHIRTTLIDQRTDPEAIELSMRIARPPADAESGQGREELILGYDAEPTESRGLFVPASSVPTEPPTAAADDAARGANAEEGGESTASVGEEIDTTLPTGGGFLLLLLPDNDLADDTFRALALRVAEKHRSQDKDAEAKPQTWQVAERAVGERNRRPALLAVTAPHHLARIDDQLLAADEAALIAMSTALKPLDPAEEGLGWRLERTLWRALLPRIERDERTPAMRAAMLRQLGAIAEDATTLALLLQVAKGAEDFAEGLHEENLMALNDRSAAIRVLAQTWLAKQGVTVADYEPFDDRKARRRALRKHLQQEAAK